MSAPNIAARAAPLWRTMSAPARRLAFAAVLAGLVTAAGVGLQLARPPADPNAWLTPLLAVAILLVGLLARRRAAGLAWASFVFASLLSSAIPVIQARAIDGRPHTFEEWLPPALAVIATSVATAVIAGLYATRPERRLGDWVVPIVVLLAGWLVAACALVVVLVWAGARADPGFTLSDVAQLPITLHLHLVLLLTSLGIAGDVRPALARADIRLAAGGRRPGWPERLRATAEELVPGLAARHDRDVEAERLRLAGDLHAVVLPSLRRAILEAETGAGPELLADRLRSVDLDLQRMVADLWPVVLDTFGLVEAIEDLAERIETESLAVEIDVLDTGGRPPSTVERVAYRVVQLACDNAIRHAGAATIRVEVAVTSSSVGLAVVDDGEGLDEQRLAEALRAGSHGLADLRRRAESVGGSVRVEPGPDGGTAIRFEWPGSGGSPSVRRDG